MLTIVDAIRLIMHSLKTIIKEGRVSMLFIIARFQIVPVVQRVRHDRIPNLAIVHKVIIM